VSTPVVFDYCDYKSIRVDEIGTIYLLKRSQMNGTHAELFTFCLCMRLKSEQFNLSCFTVSYVSVADRYSEPHIQLQCNRFGMPLGLTVMNHIDGYMIRATLQKDDKTLDGLLEAKGFQKEDDIFQIAVSRSDAGEFICDFDATLNSHLNEAFNA